MHYNKNMFSVYFVLSLVLSPLLKPLIKAKLNNLMNSKLWFAHTFHGIKKKKKEWQWKIKCIHLMNIYCFLKARSVMSF